MSTTEPTITPTTDARARLDGARADARYAQIENAAADDAFSASPTAEAWDRVLAARVAVDQASIILRGVERAASEQERTAERVAFEDALRRADPVAFWAAMEPTVLRVVELAEELRDIMTTAQAAVAEQALGVREVRAMARRLRQDEPRIEELSIDNVRIVITKRLGIKLDKTYQRHVLGPLFRFLEEHRDR